MQFPLHSGSAHCDEILADHPNEFCLPEDAADELIATAFIYLSTWYEIFEHFKPGDVPLFGLTGKAHIMLHACLLSRSGCCKIDMGPLQIINSSFLKRPKDFKDPKDFKRP